MIAAAHADSDGDGAFDCEDGCPADPEKTEPGLCGCGVPEGSCDAVCRGSFGFSLVASALFGDVAFTDVVEQVRPLPLLRLQQLHAACMVSASCVVAHR